MTSCCLQASRKQSPLMSHQRWLFLLLVWSACAWKETTMVVAATISIETDPFVETSGFIATGTESTHAIDVDADLSDIPVGRDHNNEKPRPSAIKLDGATPTSALRPVLEISTQPLSNGTNHTTPAPSTPAPSGNGTTPAPSGNGTTPAPSGNGTTPAPSTPVPTSEAPTPTPAPTATPTKAPDKQHKKEGAAFAFFRAIGKMIAWTILIALAVLFYGFCINHRYQIAYYARHAGFLCQSCYHWLLMKVSRGSNSAGRYNALYEANDAQSLNSLIFDAPGAGDPNEGFLMGQNQHQGNYQQLG